MDSIVNRCLTVDLAMLNSMLAFRYPRTSQKLLQMTKDDCIRVAAEWFGSASVTTCQALYTS